MRDRAQAIEVLAEYLTNNTRVIQTSISLSFGGRAASEAKAFYALRDAFVVNGYMDKDTAKKNIVYILEEKVNA